MAEVPVPAVEEFELSNRGDHMLTFIRCGSVALVVALTLGGSLLATENSAEATVDQPDLSITAVIDNEDYVLDEQIPVEVTITNNGAAEARAVRASTFTLSGSNFFVQSHLWGDLASWRPGVTIAPGATRVVNLWGTVSQWNGANPRARFEVRTEGNDANLADNQQDVDVSLIPPTVTGTVGGVVFGDGNNNGTLDTGEELSGVTVQLYGGGTMSERVTDVAGRFAFLDFPARLYTLSYAEAPNSWVIPYGPSVRVDGSGNTADLRIRGVRPLSETLQAEIEFTEPTYAPGDQASLKITLTNLGESDIVGIKAGCNRGGGGGPHVQGWDDPAHWGDFVWSRPGVTVPAGQTRIFDVTGIVPNYAIDYGVVVAYCDFGDDEALLEGFPRANAIAKVPGHTGDTDGRIFHDLDSDWTVDEGEQVVNTTVALFDAVTHSSVATAVTDASGRVEFTGLPAGRYQIRILGPWTSVNPDEAYTYVGTCSWCQGGWIHRVQPQS